MKILKIIGIVIVILILIFLLLGLFVPKTYHVERSISINAPQEIVFNQVKYFKNALLWSPFNEYDPNVVNTFEGTDGTIGAIVRWKGNKNVGSGSQEITALDENNRVDIKITFIEPFESVSMSYYELVPDGNTVKVTWGFDGTNEFPWNAISIFMNMDKMLGNDFEKGLNSLKGKCEGIAASIEKYGFLIQEFDFSGKVYIGKKKTLKFDEMQTFFAKNISGISKLVQENEIEMDGYPTGLYYSWDMEKMTSEMAIAIPVKGITESPSKDFDLISVGANRALKIKYYGAYENIGEAHNAMDAYMKDNNLEQLLPVMEIYVTDPSTEPDTAKWLTKVIYLVN